MEEREEGERDAAMLARSLLLFYETEVVLP